MMNTAEATFAPGERPKSVTVEDAAAYYTQLFEARLAVTQADIDECLSLRYRVYCEETKFLPAEGKVGRLERDALDERSTSVMLTHRSSGACVGTVRVILPEASEPQAGLPAISCSEEMSAASREQLNLASTGEISRFTIAPEFRRRSGDTLYQQVYDLDPSQSRRVIPYMALGLFSGILEIVMNNRLSHLCAIIDPALLRMLKRLHIHFQDIGPLVDFHGMRQPVLTSTKELYAGMRQLPGPYLNIINKDGSLRV